MPATLFTATDGISARISAAGSVSSLYTLRRRFGEPFSEGTWLTDKRRSRKPAFSPESAPSSSASRGGPLAHEFPMAEMELVQHGRNRCAAQLGTFYSIHSPSPVTVRCRRCPISSARLRQEAGSVAGGGDAGQAKRLRSWTLRSYGIRSP
eukprot:scaffold54942_cov75-Phaeocystis_antarctica.AAC.3